MQHLYGHILCFQGTRAFPKRIHLCTTLCVGFRFCKVKPIKLKSEVPLALKSFFKTVGVPPKIVCDGAPEQVKGESRMLCNKVDTEIVQLERGTPWANQAEGYKGITKSESKTDLKISNCPMVLWCYAVERRGKILSALTCNIYELYGQVPQSKLSGQQTDISSLAAFSGYIAGTLDRHSPWLWKGSEGA